MNRVDHVDILRFQFPDSCDTNNDNVEFECHEQIELAALQ